LTEIEFEENDLEFVLPEGTLPGLFSVSETQQIRFSQGNLEYQPSSSTWRFGANQLAYGNWYTGDDPYSVDWISVFGWGTGNNPTLSSNDLSDYTEFVDWGTNAISNGGNEPNLWRTLSSSEMIYLFTTRTNSTNLSTPNARFINGCVSGQDGRILFLTDTITPLAFQNRTGLIDLIITILGIPTPNPNGQKWNKREQFFCNLGVTLKYSQVILAQS
jgi:hypothetical protein